VKLPFSRPSIAAGVNQTIMFAISMATITAMIGGSGLGQTVWSGLSRLEFGQALQPGIALVLLAVLMDRVSHRMIEPGRRANRTARAGAATFARGHLRLLTSATVVVVAAVLVGLTPALATADLTRPPFEISLREPVKAAVGWVTVHFGPALDAITNLVQGYGLTPLRNALLWVPWPTTLAVVLLIGGFALGLRRGLLVTAAVATIGTLGMWAPAIDTVTVVGVAVLISLLVGFPLGVLMNGSARFASALSPVLDLMQTLPIFLFVIPTVVFLGAGPVAGTLATVLYAVPPMARLTEVGLRGVDAEAVEAATSLGATSRQILVGVRVPLGLRTIMVGVNQTILLALSMAVVSAFIGTPGLGERVLSSVSYAQLGLGIEAGTSMLLLAVVVDRVFAGLTRRFAAHRHLDAP